MRFKLHHVNVPAADVRATARFFKAALGLHEGQWIYPPDHGDLHHGPDGLAFFGTDNGGLHVVRLVPGFAKARGFAHNPTVGGHVALSVDDVQRFLDRAQGAGLEVSDAGTYAMAGMHQTYVFDPSCNLIEVNAVTAPLPAAEVAAQDPRAAVDLRSVVLPSHDLERSALFYRDIVGLGGGTRGERDGVAWARFDGDGGALYLVRHTASYAGAIHNPSLQGAFSLAVDDLELAAAQLDGQDLPFSDVAVDPLTGSRHLYIYTPSMRVVGLVAR